MSVKLKQNKCGMFSLRMVVSFTKNNKGLDMDTNKKNSTVNKKTDK